MATVSRIEWMDVLRGTSIVLVVFNHAILFANASTGAPPLAWALNEVFAPIRMPLMVLLSGLLVAPSLARGTKRYIVGKARRVLYPYLVWSAIALLLLAVWGIRDGLIGGADPVGDPATWVWWTPLQVLFSPVEHLWFLYDLFVFYMIALAVRWISPLWIAAAAMAAAAVIPDFEIRRFFFLLVFFMIGVWFSRRSGLIDRVLAKPWVIWLSAALALGIVAAVALGGGIRYMAISAPFVAAGIVLAIIIAKKIGGARWLRPLRFAGRDSLVFYLVHWWPTSAGVALGSLTGNGWTAILIGFLAGLAACTAVAWSIRLWPPINWLFSAPQRRVVPLEARSRDSF